MSTAMKDWLAVALVLAGLSGCRRDSQPGEESPAMETPPQSPPGAVIDTTGAALWARLQSENYQSWDLWPGKSKLYSGQEPHGALLTTYVNALARDALMSGAGSLPEGAIVVKENYGPDRTLMGITVMHKVNGYDPQHHDWFWAKYMPDGKEEMSGRADMCYNCHQGAAEYDGLWTLQIAKTGKKPPPTKM